MKNKTHSCSGRKPRCASSNCGDEIPRSNPSINAKWAIIFDTKFIKFNT